MHEAQVKDVLQKLYNEYEHKKQRAGRKSITMMDAIASQNVILRIAQEMNIVLKEKE